MTRPRRWALFVLMPMVAMTWGCDTTPFELPWEENPFEATLYSLDRAELNRPSAYDMARRARIIIEGLAAEGRWDFAVDRMGGQMVLLPPRALGVISRAAIVPIPGVEYDDVREAPSDTLAYIRDEAVPVDMGTIYVVRTHEQVGQFGQRCVFYGRIEILEIDVEDGILRFRSDTSPDCNNRKLVPPGS